MTDSETVESAQSGKIVYTPLTDVTLTPLTVASFALTPRSGVDDYEHRYSRVLYGTTSYHLTTIYKQNQQQINTMGEYSPCSAVQPLSRSELLSSTP